MFLLTPNIQFQPWLCIEPRPRDRRTC